MALMKYCADKSPCPGMVPEYYLRERVPTPGYCAQVFVRAPLKCYVHIGARAQAPNPGTKSGRSLGLGFGLGLGLSFGLVYA